MVPGQVRNPDCVAAPLCCGSVMAGAPREEEPSVQIGGRGFCLLDVADYLRMSIFFEKDVLEKHRQKKKNSSSETFI